MNLITVTGAAGYITERTFARAPAYQHGTRLLGRGFALRWIPYGRIAGVLARYGLVTDQLSRRTFHQRRFADETERDYVLSELGRMGISSVGREAEGRYHANLYLSHPAEHDHPPLQELLAGCWD